MGAQGELGAGKRGAPENTEPEPTLPTLGVAALKLWLARKTRQAWGKGQIHMCCSKTLTAGRPVSLALFVLF